MRIKFWGVRGSLPAPVSSDRIAGKIAAALKGAKGIDLEDDQAIKRYVAGLPPETRGTTGGNTSCVEVRIGGHQIILDAGSGLRELGLDMMKREFGSGRGEAHFFISHSHWDHIHGFPFFIPAFIPGNRFYIYSPKKTMEQKLSGQQAHMDLFPKRLDEMPADKEFIHMNEAGVDLGRVHADYIPLHHPGGSWAYRFKAGDKTLVYATDGEYKDLSTRALQPYLDFFKNADLLIFDAMYTFGEAAAKEGWGHSTPLVGVDLAVAAGVRRLALFHHDPTYTDADLALILKKTRHYHALVGEKSPLEIILAREGEELAI